MTLTNLLRYISLKRLRLHKAHTLMSVCGIALGVSAIVSIGIVSRGVVRSFGNPACPLVICRLDLPAMAVIESSKRWRMSKPIPAPALPFKWETERGRVTAGGLVLRI